MAVDKMVYKYVSRDRSSVVSAITHAVDSGSDKRKVEDKLMGYVDKSLAYKLAEKAFAILEDLGAKVKTSSRKRIHKDENEREKESKRPRVKEEKEPPVESKPPPPPSSGPNNTVSPGQIQAQQIKDIMAKAQAVIEERKKAMASLHPPEPKPTTNGAAVPLMPGPPPSLLGAMGGGGDVNSRIAELQARIQAQLVSNPTLSLPGLPVGVPVGTPPSPAAAAKPVGEQSKPTPLILDAEGRTVDQSGKEVHLTQRIPTLKANIRAKKT